MRFHGPDHGADELGLQKLDPAQAATVVSGLAENCANELFTSTAVFATTPPRSSASRIAVSFTASATLSSVAIFSSARPSCRLLLPSGAELLHGPAVRVHRVGGTRLHRRLRLVCICRRFFYALYSDVRALRVSRFPTTLHST